MYSVMLNAIWLLVTVIAVVLIAAIIIIGVVAVYALISKVIDIWKGGKPKSGGQ